MSLAREIVFVSVICCAQLLTQVGPGQTIAPLQIIADSFEVTTLARRAGSSLHTHCQWALSFWLLDVW